VPVTVTRDPEAFRARAEGWLAARPVEHNVLVTVAAAAREGTFAWLEENGAVLAAVLRTPPHALLTCVLDRQAADALIPAVLEADPDLPGVTGPEPAANHVAKAWRAHTGGAVEPATALVLYAVAEVVAPARPPAGVPRLARLDERDELIEWARAFTHEAGATADPPEVLVDRRMADDRLFVWDDGGPASLVGTSPPVAGVVRVSLVYTPPAARGRGYASALVAAVSSRAIAAGAAQCMLYADRANPTANRIYQAIGYRRVTDARDYALVASSRTGAPRLR
jgi:predicted GNAT family acetyltransferase